MMGIVTSIANFLSSSNLSSPSTPQEPVGTNKVTPSQSAIDDPETKPWPQFYSDTPIIARVETINPRAYEGETFTLISDNSFY